IDRAQGPERDPRRDHERGPRQKRDLKLETSPWYLTIGGGERRSGKYPACFAWRYEGDGKHGDHFFSLISRLHSLPFKALWARNWVPAGLAPCHVVITGKISRVSHASPNHRPVAPCALSRPPSPAAA